MPLLLFLISLVPFRTLHHNDVVRNLAFSADSAMLATTSVDGTVKLWRTSDGKLVRVLHHPAGVTSAAFSPGGEWLVSGCYDHDARLWRVRDGALVRTMHGHTATIWSVAFSQNAIATAGEDATVRMWRTDGTPLRVLHGHARNVWHVAFSPDGTLVGSSSFDDTIRLWRAGDGAPLRTLTGHKQAIVGFAFSRDGRLLASGSDDSTIRIWRVADGRVLRVIDVGNHTYTVAFSPDGKYLVSGGRERGALGTLWKQLAGPAAKHGVTVRIWRVADGALLREFAAQADDVVSVVWSPDGKWIASGSEDRTVVLWRVAWQ